MKLKYALTLVLIFSITKSSFSQERALTKEQMHADFDHLVRLISNTNPYLSIKKELFSYSILDTIESLRPEIERCNNPTDFQLLISNIMNTCLDGHCALITPLNWPEINLYLPLYYQNGAYIIKRDFSYNGRQFKAGSNLIAINNNPKINQEVTSQIPYRYLIRWDNVNKTFYSEQFYLSQEYINDGKIKLTFQLNEDTITETFKFKERVEISPKSTTDVKRVEYFESDKILYVRVPSMNWSDRKFYKKQIATVSKEKVIDKVVIDVRHNMGGSSIVGRTIFRSILPSPIEFHSRIYGASDENITGRYSKIHGFNRTAHLEHLSELDSLEMTCFINETEIIEPFRSSIQHKGSIFIIGNEHVYSAGGAIFMFANHSSSDSIYSIGTPTGWFLGEFTDPIKFTLPHSNLEVQVAPTMSLSNVTDWKNVMLDHYNYEIHPTVDDFNRYYEQQGILYSKDYLFNHDPYFKHVIEHL